MLCIGIAPSKLPQCCSDCTSQLFDCLRKTPRNQAALVEGQLLARNHQGKPAPVSTWASMLPHHGQIPDCDCSTSGGWKKGGRVHGEKGLLSCGHQCKLAQGAAREGQAASTTTQQTAGQESTALQPLASAASAGMPPSLATTKRAEQDQGLGP